MTGSVGVGDGPVERVGLCLSVAVVNRVSAIVPLFFGRLAGIMNTDAFDINAGVEMVWRDLDGYPRLESQVLEINSRMPAHRAISEESTRSERFAVLAALDAVSALTDESLLVWEQLQTVMTSAVRVASEFDMLGVNPPTGNRTWLSFELRGQAELFELLPITALEVSPLTVHELRTMAGMEAMKYRSAMKSIP